MTEEPGCPASTGTNVALSSLEATASQSTTYQCFILSQFRPAKAALPVRLPKLGGAHPSEQF